MWTTNSFAHDLILLVESLQHVSPLKETKPKKKIAEKSGVTLKLVNCEVTPLTMANTENVQVIRLRFRAWAHFVCCLHISLKRESAMQCFVFVCFSDKAIINARKLLTGLYGVSGAKLFGRGTHWFTHNKWPSSILCMR